MALNDTALNLMADALADSGLFLALHTATPSAAGSDESAAARLGSGWGAASGGDIAISSAMEFTGGVSDGSVTHFGIWSALTAGTFYGSFAITGDSSFNGAGEYTLDSASISGT